MFISLLVHGYLQRVCFDRERGDLIDQWVPYAFPDFLKVPSSAVNLSIF